MSQLEAVAGPHATGRDLENPPVTYRPVRVKLGAGLDTIRVYDLWEQVFGEDKSDNDDIITISVEFAMKVDLELFPVEWGAIFNFYGEDVFNMPIPLSGWCLPLQADTIDDYLDIPEWQISTIVTIDWNYFRIGGFDWFPDHIAIPPDIWWLQSWSTPAYWLAGLSWLADQGPQWDGLANLIRISLYPVEGNPFLSLPGWRFVDEYIDDIYYWTTEDLNILGGHWRRARPVVERIKQFQAWFEAEPEGTERHLRVLEMLDESGKRTA